MKDLKWLPKNIIKQEYNESGELLTIFTSIGKKGKQK